MNGSHEVRMESRGSLCYACGLCACCAFTAAVRGTAPLWEGARGPPLLGRQQHSLPALCSQPWKAALGSHLSRIQRNPRFSISCAEPLPSARGELSGSAVGAKPMETL